MRHKRKEPHPTATWWQGERIAFAAKENFPSSQALMSTPKRAFACHLQVQNQALEVFLFDQTLFFFLSNKRRKHTSADKTRLRYIFTVNKQQHVGGHKDKERQLITFLHDEGKQTTESDYTRFLLLYQQWLLRNSTSDWLEWAG
ncbi:hypothetical protein TNCV_4456691 [Trichonephila clavipes]|nr:hypothetical protein TNCV_4456691 [Trichonephila clavipes]